ncbi:membrane protein [Mycobacterium gastri 'Wayne']|nr:membrane protein [Mycobacterium gastri 'Wayne']
MTKREARVPGNRRGGDRRGGGDRRVATNRHTAADSASRRSRAGKATAARREARMPKSGPQTSPMPRPVDRPARPKNTSQAKARAKARKAKAPKVVRPKLSERLAVRLASVDLRPRTLLSKVPFVVLVIGSLGVGLALTLWLSTDAAERSYQLSHARERTRILQQQKEALERDVREAGSAPALAEAARKQGMIPTRDTAHLVQAPDGNWVVVGTPKPADGVPPPPLNTKLPEEGPPPPPKPPLVPPEVPVRVLPGPGDPAPPARSGPQLLPRTPDGASTLGADGSHLPGQLPGVPGVPGQAPSQLQPPAPVGSAPGAPLQLPGQVPALIPAPVPAPVPAEVPIPLQSGTAPPVLGAPPAPAAPMTPVAPAAPAPPVSVHAPQLIPPPAPSYGEQFAPVTPTVPAALGGPR